MESIYINEQWRKHVTVIINFPLYPPTLLNQAHPSLNYT